MHMHIPTTYYIMHEMHHVSVCIPEIRKEEETMHIFL